MKYATSDSKDVPCVKLLCGGDLLESFAVPGLWNEEHVCIFGRIPYPELLYGFKLIAMTVVDLAGNTRLSIFPHFITEYCFFILKDDCNCSRLWLSCDHKVWLRS